AADTANAASIRRVCRRSRRSLIATRPATMRTAASAFSEALRCGKNEYQGSASDGIAGAAAHGDGGRGCERDRGEQEADHQADPDARQREGVVGLSERVAQEAHTIGERV